MQKKLICPNLLFKTHFFLHLCNFVFFGLFSGLFCSSCSGYHVASSLKEGNTHTVSIPYVEGDSRGELTNRLIETLETQGGLQYVPDNGDLALKVRILDEKHNNVGFRCDPKKIDKDRKRLIPNETRSKILVEITILDSITQKKLLGPSYILGSVDFDHQYYFLNKDVNVFSLGQLSDVDTANDVINIPVYREVSRKIVEYIQNNFDNIQNERESA